MKLVIRDCVISFPSLFKTAQYNGQDLGKYEATFLIAKDHPQLKEIQAAVKAVGQDAFGAKWHKAKMCLRDGDDKPDLKGYEGTFTLKATTKKRPVIVDRAKASVTEDDGLVYGGADCSVSLSLFAFTNAYGDFISAQLNGVQMHGTGEPFGGNDDGYSDDDFDLDDSPVADDGDAPF